MIVSVIQSNYIPWKGYFDIIHDSDVFVFYDDVQYTKNGWRNRNKIKTPKGASWVTIPVGSHLDKLVCEIELNNDSWQKKHWLTIEQFYSKAPHFDEYKDFFSDFYLGSKWESLSILNQHLIKNIASDFLGIKTKFMDSRDFDLNGCNVERLICLLRKIGADTYISGPAAKNYIIDDIFEKEGIRLVYKDYTQYPEYSQFHPPFDHNVSIIDLLFHAGPDAPD
ncbi:MAG TPA: WbqC family protein, partial [bacterium]|nr:WbqC family protein [bacterium]